MTQYEALNNKTVKVQGIKNQSYRKQDSDQLFVDKVVLDVEDHEIPKGRITINPQVRDTEVVTKKVNGRKVENEINSKRDPSITEMFSEFPRIDQIFEALESYPEIELTGLIRAVRDSEDDEWNFFIRASELNKVKASVPDQVKEEDKDKTEKVAEDFVEDQTSIETEGSEESEENGNKDSEGSDVIFGEEENE